MADSTAGAATLMAEDRAAARAARKADNRAKHLAKQERAGTGPRSETPEFDAQQRQALDDFLQSITGPAKGLSVVVLQVTPQRHGETMGRPAHVLEQPYSPGLTEADLKSMAMQTGTADPGTFEVRILRDGKIKHVFHTTWRWKAEPLIPGATDPLAEIDRFAKTAVMLKSLAGNGVIDAAMVNALKPQVASTPPMMERLIEAVVARLAAPDRPADPIETLARATTFLDQVRGPAAAPTNPMDMLKGLGEMLATVKALAGGLGPAEPASSPWIEVLRLVGGALGPLVAQVPAMWSMADARRQAGEELRKRELLAGLVRGHVPLPLAAQIAGVALPAASGPITPGRPEPPAESATSAADGPSAGPLASFHHAIVEGDTSVFPTLAAVIMGLPNGAGPKILDGLASDPNALALIRDQIDANGARAFFAELFLPGSDPFFGAFAEWLRAQGATE